jgi:hypothetical protein
MRFPFLNIILPEAMNLQPWKKAGCGAKENATVAKGPPFFKEEEPTSPPLSRRD